jgi:hypothetical protein
MRDYPKHFPVNWIDGMKINRNHFIAQDDAWKDALHDVGSLSTSPLRFGILPSSAAGEDTFNVKLSLDNQDVLRVSVLSCQAITPGGIRINLPGPAGFANNETDGVPALSFPFSEAGSEATWWVVLIINPFERQPAGSPDLSETPPRYPYVVPVHTVEVVSDNEYRRFAYHPYAITIGRVMVNGNNVRVDEDYIPPCYAISASPDLVSLHAELDKFLSRLELLCTQIVQKILQKNQQNDISELVMFLCDRLIRHLGQSITSMRWTVMHESPAALFACIASLARVMKNTIDLRTGSGKEEMMNYLTDWCELKQGELESMLGGLANLRFDNNDNNRNIQKVVPFVKTTSRLFETLNKLDFIGKRRESGIFVKEEKAVKTQQPEVKAPKRRFLG